MQAEEDSGASGDGGFADRDVGSRGRHEPIDRQALEGWLVTELPRLRAFVRANVPADVRLRESCSDLVHSVCREVIQNGELEEYRGPEAFRAWLFRWALHKIRDKTRYWRADKRDRNREADIDQDRIAELYASVPSPSAGAIAREDVALFERAMDELREEDRLVIGLCRIAGLPRGEVAQALGKSAGAVGTHLHRALVRLGLVLQRLESERHGGA